ncbi:AraC family transcriptional regulator [Sulfitobacter sp. F26204]|uniref:AraC family transcriptional regulator n=1 Tax=Sulfitobacter sp. F26204 TaxID=2996014 RepID=UPI00225E046B|nr:AraC family transcriptional regulator [Sulfitobacter sp. F26204]MCX7558429.1 AraC family transcriptional regulator [Sulfitobacter sp. F26204]
MYNPKGNSREKTAKSVSFVETEPPEHLRGIVHRFLELDTKGALPDDYRFHALPDACTYIVFDQLNPQVTGVTKLRASSEELNLGRIFRYINIRFLPGVWQNALEQVSYGMIDSPYTGDLPLIPTNQSLVKQDFAANQSVLTALVEGLVEQGFVVSNPVTERIFNHLDSIYSVADMAEVSNLSPRQLQRTLKRTTGFTPHDFLKVLRLQQALIGDPSLSYADQSHFIHSFRKATGYTPGKYAKKFDV